MRALNRNGLLVALAAGFLEGVMHDRLARRLIDRLALGQLHLLMNLVQREAGAEPCICCWIDEDVARLDEAIDDAARAVELVHPAER